MNTESMEGPSIRSELSKEVEAYLKKMGKTKLPEAGATDQEVKDYIAEDLSTIKVHAEAVRAASQVMDRAAQGQLVKRDNRPLLVRATPTAEQLSKELEETYGIVLDPNTLATDLEAAQLRIAEAEVSEEIQKLVDAERADAEQVHEIAGENHAAHAAAEVDPKIATEKPTVDEAKIWRELRKKMPDSVKQVLRDMISEIKRVVASKNEELQPLLQEVANMAMEFARDQWIKDLPEDQRAIAEKYAQRAFDVLVGGKIEDTSAGASAQAA